MSRTERSWAQLRYYYTQTLSHSLLRWVETKSIYWIHLRCVTRTRSTIAVSVLLASKLRLPVCANTIVSFHVHIFNRTHTHTNIVDVCLSACVSHALLLTQTRTIINWSERVESIDLWSHAFADEHNFDSIEWNKRREETNKRIKWSRFWSRIVKGWQNVLKIESTLNYFDLFWMLDVRLILFLLLLSFKFQSWLHSSMMVNSDCRHIMTFPRWAHKHTLHFTGNDENIHIDRFISESFKIRRKMCG